MLKILLSRLLTFGIVVVVLLLAMTGFAKDLTHRVGVGMKNNSSENIPSLAAVYYASKEYAYTAGFGIDTKPSYNAMQGQIGLRKMIYLETNLNFYVGGHLGFTTFEAPTFVKASGLDAVAVLGSEFFFTGLENLGFTVEAGVGVSTLVTTRIRTVADDPFRAGIIFYF